INRTAKTCNTQITWRCNRTLGISEQWFDIMDSVENSHLRLGAALKGHTLGGTVFNPLCTHRDLTIDLNFPLLVKSELAAQPFTFIPKTQYLISIFPRNSSRAGN